MCPQPFQIVPGNDARASIPSWPPSACHAPRCSTSVCPFRDAVKLPLFLHRPHIRDRPQHRPHFLQRNIVRCRIFKNTLIRLLSSAQTTATSFCSLSIAYIPPKDLRTHALYLHLSPLMASQCAYLASNSVAISFPGFKFIHLPSTLPAEVESEAILWALGQFLTINPRAAEHIK